MVNTSNKGRDQRGEEERGKRAKRAVDRLERAVEQFRIDSQRFLAGDLPLPPDELREKIQNELRRLRNSNIQSSALRFRLGSLESKLNSQVQLLGRRIRAREEGERTRRPEMEAAKRHDPVKGIVVGREVGSDQAEALYRGLNNPKMDLDRFRTYLDRQARSIRDKTGCSEIQFRLAVKEGKLKLKAKPIRR